MDPIVANKRAVKMHGSRFVPRDGDGDGMFSPGPGMPDKTPVSQLPIDHLKDLTDDDLLKRIDDYKPYVPPDGRIGMNPVIEREKTNKRQEVIAEALRRGISKKDLKKAGASDVDIQAAELILKLRSEFDGEDVPGRPGRPFPGRGDDIPGGPFRPKPFNTPESLNPPGGGDAARPGGRKPGGRRPGGRRPGGGGGSQGGDDQGGGEGQGGGGGGRRPGGSRPNAQGGSPDSDAERGERRPGRPRPQPAPSAPSFKPPQDEHQKRLKNLKKLNDRDLLRTWSEERRKQTAILNPPFNRPAPDDPIVQILKEVMDKIEAEILDRGLADKKEDIFLAALNDEVAEKKEKEKLDGPTPEEALEVVND